MTKQVRIENADMANYKVLVQVFEKSGGEAPDVLVREVYLNHPTAMTDSSVYLTSSRYIVVSEVQE